MLYITPCTRLNPNVFDFCTVKGIWTLDEIEDQLSLSFYFSLCIIHQNTDQKSVSFITLVCCSYLYSLTCVQLSFLTAPAEDIQ